MFNLILPLLNNDRNITDSQSKNLKNIQSGQLKFQAHEESSSIESSYTQHLPKHSVWSFYESFILFFF